MLTRFSTTFQKSGRVPDFFWGARQGAPAWKSDIDLMVIRETVTYADLHAALESVATRLGRALNPTACTRKQLAKRRQEDVAFIKRVLAQPKVWLKGSDDVLPA